MGRPGLHCSSLLAGLLLCCLTQTTPSAAQSGPPRGPALNWVRLSGAESCITPVELAKRVEQRLGRAVFVRANDAILVIEGRVAPDPAGGYRTVLRVGDADGTLYGVREFSVANSDCHKLDEIVTLVIAITIRHEQAGSSGIALPPEVAAQLDILFADEPSTLGPSEVSATAARVSAPDMPGQRALAPRPSSAPAQPASVLGVSAEIGFGLVTGLQPATTFGPSVRLRATFVGLGSVALSGGLGLVQLQAISAEAPGTLRYQPMQLGLSACPPSWQMWLTELALCAELRVGRLIVRGSDFVHNNHADEVWPELAAAASARTALSGPTYLQLRLGVPTRLVRPAFRYLDGQGQEHAAFVVARLGIELELGVGARF